MTLDGLLAVLALTAAIYALIPPVPRLRFRLAVWIQLPVAVVAFFSVLYLEFFESVGHPCPQFLGRACAALTFERDGTFKPNQLAFLLVLTWMVFAWVVHKLAQPGAGALIAMRRLADRLVYEQRFAELTDFLEPYLPFIGRAADRKLPLQRLSIQMAEWRGDGLISGAWRGLLNLPPEKPTTGWSAWRKLLPWIGKLGRRFPSHREAEEAARELLRLLLTTPVLESPKMGVDVSNLRLLSTPPRPTLRNTGPSLIPDASSQALTARTGQISAIWAWARRIAWP
ncbi:MAG: hypothetical protein V4820_09665 [Pseudomonadota bacterium]